MNQTPKYLKNFKDTWNTDPHQANMEWFSQAKFGLFIHYGLYALLERGEWVQFHEQIPVAEYAKLKERFTAEKFDADFITDLALEAEMKYVNLVTCHHEGFCLWDSATEPFNSVNSPCGRDLVRELAEQCEKKGLGFFTYYTFMLNWRHPYSLPRERLSMARPDYKDPQPEYRFQSMQDYDKYISYMQSCLGELLALEYPLTGVWLDIIKAYYENPEICPVDSTYAMIRKARPETLIAFKQGATGEEDYASPEHTFQSLGDKLRKEGLNEAAERADRAWDINRTKHNEICTTLQHSLWGYNKNTTHVTVDELWKQIAHALSNNCNLLTNVGPLPDGSIHPEDIKTLRAVGERIRKEDWPESTTATSAPDIKRDQTAAPAAE